MGWFVLYLPKRKYMRPDRNQMYPVKRYSSVLVVYLLLFFVVACDNRNNTPGDYSSDTLKVYRVSDHVYVHLSYLETESFGKVECNGAIFFDNGEAVILDTPAGREDSEELIRWVTDSLGCTIKAVVPTHFHKDCLGGLQEFHRKDIPSYAENATTTLAASHGFPVPQHGFDQSQTLRAGTLEIELSCRGAGHTTDNITAYLSGDHVLFGGCLIKASGASKGNLEDADVAAWPETVERIKSAYPEVKIVIPGHGDTGGKELLDYTEILFRS